METLFLVGRVIYAGILAFMGLNHFMQLENMTGYAQMKGLPMPRLAVIVSGIWLVVGCLGIIFNFQMLYAGIMVAIFLVATAVLMHNFWAVEDQNMKMNDMVNFMKNLALAGAALAIAALGA